MPTRRNQPPEAQRRPRLRRSREEAARLLQERIALGKQIADRIDPGAYVSGHLAELEAEVSSWSDYNKELLRALFDTSEVADNYDPFIGIA